MRRYGYVRVSTREQNEARQLLAMSEAKISEADIFMDKQSGKDFERPMYKMLLKALRPGDIVYIKSIDRLGRSYKDIIVQWKLITQKINADIIVLDMPILDTTRGKDLMGTFLTDVVLAILSYVAENERANILQRQSEGIAAAKERGVRFGAPRIKTPENFYTALDLWSCKKMSLREAARMCGLPKSTFYDKVKEQTY